MSIEVSSWEEEQRQIDRENALEEKEPELKLEEELKDPYKFLGIKKPKKKKDKPLIVIK